MILHSKTNWFLLIQFGATEFLSESKSTNSCRKQMKKFVLLPNLSFAPKLLTTWKNEEVKHTGFDRNQSKVEK